MSLIGLGGIGDEPRALTSGGVRDADHPNYRSDICLLIRTLHWRFGFTR
jgi:hypothetical protein